MEKIFACDMAWLPIRYHSFRQGYHSGRLAFCLNFRPFFHATCELKMPGFQGVSALVGKILSGREPSLTLRYHGSMQTTRSNLAKNKGVLQLMFELIQKQRSKMAER